MKAPQEISTVRLVLALPRPGDADEIFERYASDPDVTTYLGWPGHRSVDETRAFLAFSASEWERWPAGPYLIRDRSDGRLLGGTGLGFQSTDRAITGYVLARDAWGRGYATEALAAMVELARALGVVHLSALCHPKHRASWRVLEKCGFTRSAESPQVEFPNLSPGELQPAMRYELVLTLSR